MVYGSAADVTVVERFVPPEEFRKVRPPDLKETDLIRLCGIAAQAGNGS
jgi:hypothetical protein